MIGYILFSLDFIAMIALGYIASELAYNGEYYVEFIYAFMSAIFIYVSSYIMSK